MAIIPNKHWKFCWSQNWDDSQGWKIVCPTWNFIGSFMGCVHVDDKRWEDSRCVTYPPSRNSSAPSLARFQEYIYYNSLHQGYTDTTCRCSNNTQWPQRWDRYKSGDLYLHEEYKTLKTWHAVFRTDVLTSFLPFHQQLLIVIELVWISHKNHF